MALVVDELTGGLSDGSVASAIPKSRHALELGRLSELRPDAHFLVAAVGRSDVRHTIDHRQRPSTVEIYAASLHIKPSWTVMLGVHEP